MGRSGRHRHPGPSTDLRTTLRTTLITTFVAVAGLAATTLFAVTRAGTGASSASLTARTAIPPRPLVHGNRARISRTGHATRGGRTHGRRPVRDEPPAPAATPPPEPEPSTTPSEQPTPPKPRRRHRILSRGACQASYYGMGGRTASGQNFDAGALTAAHRSLPIGARVRVINRHNDRSVVVRINDRGPFVHGRCLDLSSAAMQAVGGLGSGVIPVRYEVLTGV